MRGGRRKETPKNWLPAAMESLWVVPQPRPAAWGIVALYGLGSLWFYFQVLR